jgi:16S rRNA (uracil1498-N3)-methyltransferase
MHRFFVSPEGFSNKTVTIQGPDVDHIRKVLRMKPGDRIGVVDNQGFQHKIVLSEVERDFVRGEILSTFALKTESPVKICMGQALIKGSGFDFLVRKATELGVHTIVPLITQHCVARLPQGSEVNRTQRWQRIAAEASKQCGRTRVPEVYPAMMSVEPFCRQFSDCDLKLVFWEGETRTRLHDIPADASVSSIAFLAGPEGGWADSEIELLRNQGYQTVSLGPRLLRADSVSLVILSLLQHRWGDL